MRHPKGTPCHQCAPSEYRRTPDITGSFELDSVIKRNGNRDIPARLAYYCKGQGDDAYTPVTAYNGYSNYSGDS